VEALATIAPPEPIRSLRAGTRANAVREARFCYDHLAGRLGVALMSALIERRALIGGDGEYHPESAVRDRLSAPRHDIAYRLTDGGAALFDELGVDVAALAAGRRPLVRTAWTGPSSATTFRARSARRSRRRCSNSGG